MSDAEPSKTSFWQRLRGSRRMMLIALSVLAVSQFMTYAELFEGLDWTGGIRSDANWNTSSNMDSMFNPVGTGWEMHPQAKWIVPLLFVAYLSPLCELALWRNWGYLLSVLLVFLSLTPGQWTTNGLKLGFVALGLTIWAAWKNRHERKLALHPT